MVVKIPRFAFEKFPGADPTLTTHMKSVGEAMAIGRSFAEALQKAQRSLESPTGPLRFTRAGRRHSADELLDRCRTPHDGRLNTMLQALRAGASAEAVAEATGVDPWFVEQLENIQRAIQNDRGRRRARPARCCGRRRRPGSPTPPSPSCAA